MLPPCQKVRGHHHKDRCLWDKAIVPNASEMATCRSEAAAPPQGDQRSKCMGGGDFWDPYAHTPGLLGSPDSWDLLAHFPRELGSLDS